MRDGPIFSSVFSDVFHFVRVCKGFVLGRGSSVTCTPDLFHLSIRVVHVPPFHSPWSGGHWVQTVEGTDVRDPLVRTGSRGVLRSSVISRSDPTGEDP